MTNSLTKEDYKKLAEIEDKLFVVEELTEEEEDFYVENTLNNGDTTLGTT